MPSLSKQAIVDRVRLFVDSVRTECEGFKPENCWWLLNDTKLSRKKYPDAILLLDQMGILEDDMKKHYTSHWASKIGDGTFGDVLRQGKDKRSIFVTVRSANVNDSSNTSPQDDPTKIVGGVFHPTRHSKWAMLREKISPTAISPTIKQPSTFLKTVKR